ncbi:transporter [Altererythrobacter sp. Root672]|uniref:transporter n=1 Tax=Altererythrobacter sp. Root672 TaxID=1736584 RepID=UPI0006F8C1CC|nr:transporter [Altererythrobacter sp. Root672]
MRSVCAWPLLTAVLFATPVMAQDDGARLYMLAPKDTTIASVRVHSLHSNVGTDTGTVSDDPNLNTTLVVFQFVQEFEVGRQQHMAFLVVPGSRIHSEVGLVPGGPPDSVTGLGDVQLGYVVGLYGTPSLPAADYAVHPPGLAVNLLGKLFLPTGKYSDTRTTNIGANRFAVRLGVPIVYAIGKGMGDPSLTTIELMPTVTFYGSNDRPYGAERMTQAPLLIVEGHLTRGLAKGFWASLDMLWRRGGETEVDGVKSDNSQQALSLGVTGVVALPQRWSLRLSGGAVVSRNEHGPNGWMARAILGTAF